MRRDGVTLFCIPHAGGSAAYYAGLGAFFKAPAGATDAPIDFHPLELPGRGRRHREPLLPDMNALARDMFTRVAPVAESGPYALFGHSMGALLAFLCTLLVRDAGLPAPAALFISSAAAPLTYGEILAPISPLPSQEFWERVGVLGGVPQCLTENDGFLRYLEPILRADFAAVENWRPEPVAPLPTPITVFVGADDVMTVQRAGLWRPLTTGAFRLRTFPGGHFYLQDHWEALARDITRTLANG